MTIESALASKLSVVSDLISNAFSDASLPVLLCDPNMTIVQSNQAAAEQLGDSTSGLSGRDFMDLLKLVCPADECQSVLSNLARNQEYVGRISLGGINSSAKLRHLRAYPHARPESTSPAYWTVVISPVENSESRAVNIIDMDRNLTKGEMSSEIAHEINNHLTILMGNIELIPLFLKTGSTEKLLEKAERMRKALDMISFLTDTLSEFGMIYGTKEQIDLRMTIEKMIRFLTPQNRFDDIDVEFRCSGDDPFTLCHPGQIQQAIAALLVNAADELKDSGIKDGTVTIDLHPESDGWRIVVADNGRGVLPEISAELFKNPVSSRKNGEGYGLLAAFQIARNHGGMLSVGNRSGGAEFTLYLPKAD